MTLTIRDARVTDIPAIFEVRTSVHENHLSVAQMAEMGITAETIREVLQQEPCIWVAECEDRILGFSMADLSEACVFAAFVRPEHEGKGIGRQLMDRAEAYLFAHHPSIWLETHRSSRAAGFYQRLGWTRMQDLERGDARFEKQRPGKSS